MKKISVLIPCYNEEENVEPISQAVIETLERDLPRYDMSLYLLTMTPGTIRVPFFAVFARKIRKSRRFLMPEISDSLILPTMLCCR